MNYKIVASGSSGNAVVVDDMLFECGIPFSRLKDYLYGVRYLFITHAHTDHLNVKTYNSIRNNFPRIETIGNWDVGKKVLLDHLIGDSTEIEFKDRSVKSFLCPHDIPCHGFVVQIDGLNMMYATDTSTLENAPKLKYDYMFIESNHDENKIKQIQNNARKKYGYDAWRSALRHLSTQQSKAFYYVNRRSENSRWIELHKSERFY